MLQTAIPGPPPATTEPRLDGAVIAVEGLHVRYGDTVAVQDVSFSVQEGEIFGLLGPNGAGKTTTVECIAGLRQADRGEIRVLGLAPGRDESRLRDVLGIQLQSAELPDKLRVGEALQLFASFYRDPADPAELLARLGLADKRATRFANLSGGQRQRLSIALALIGNPRLAVLDELTTGLDPRARRETWQLIEQIRDRGVTVLLVTHFMDEAQRLCDRVAVLDRGRVVRIDSPAALTAAGQRLDFRISASFDLELLRELPEVASAERRGERVLVAGSGDLLAAVTERLLGYGVVPRGLRLEQDNLEDVFVALTNHDPAGEEHR